jgi:VWFA-related protein
MVRIVTLGAALSVLAVTVSAQQTRPPAFRSRVELLSVEASVVDSGGRPVRDLQPADFKVQVDGKPRQVLFSRFSGVEERRAAGVTAAPAVATHVSNGVRGDGRIVIFVVDRESISDGTQKGLFDTASSLIDTLTPADSVGMVSLPNTGIELTRDHARVRAAVKALTGARPVPVDAYDMSWDEALAYERQDQATIDNVRQRECNTDRACFEHLDRQWYQVLSFGRSHTRALLSALEGLARKLEPIHASKHIVLITGGLPFHESFLRDYRTFAQQAAAAQIVLMSVFVDQHPAGAGEAQTQTVGRESRDLASGLGQLTSLAGGAFYEGIARAKGTFDTLRSDLDNFYTLGIESLPGDADGKPHEIKIDTARRGINVRSRRHVVLPERLNKTAAVSVPERLAELLVHPVDISDLPLSVASYTLRGTDEKTLKVIVSGEMGGASSQGPADWAFAIIKDENTVASLRQHIEPTGPGPWVVSGERQLAPGRYRIRIAGIDAEGREGLVDVPLVVGMFAAGDFLLSDTVVGTGAESHVEPRSTFQQGQALAAVIEIGSNDLEKLATASAVLELYPTGGTDVAARAVMSMHAQGAPLQWAQASLDTAPLTPGRYTASVTVKAGAVPLARVSRAFEIVAPK